MDGELHKSLDKIVEYSTSQALIATIKTTRIYIFFIVFLSALVHFFLFHVFKTLSIHLFFNIIWNLISERISITLSEVSNVSDIYDNTFLQMSK